MTNRTVYGNDWSENGWPMVDEGRLLIHGSPAPTQFPCGLGLFIEERER